ncbi:MAG: class I SAM-dependent methyltransferase [Bacteroidia bacterium]|nr:class I SAM-dependent methyltransferase [Bacteroidia bacterium]
MERYRNKRHSKTIKRELEFPVYIHLMISAPEIIHDILRWDVKAWSPALDFWETRVNWERVNNCLELGSREGGLSLWLAQKGKKVVCSDLENPENHASALHRKYGIQELVEYAAIDATSIPFENQFDLILFKSIIGGIGRNGRTDLQHRVFGQIQKALKPGGYLLFAENLRASILHQWLRRKYTPWGRSWRYLSVKELNEMMSAFQTVEIHATGFSSAFVRSHSFSAFFAGLDQKLLNYLIPADWKYIGYGMALKK